MLVAGGSRLWRGAASADEADDDAAAAAASDVSTQKPSAAFSDMDSDGLREEQIEARSDYTVPVV